jgi:5-formaminoimidazole-4-carboxamide-1-(beta)-D-ribofuranosyl 5'-monophosphate synthetase
MVNRKHFDVASVLRDYDLNDLTIATICSHTSLQIFDGARKEGFHTLGIATKRQSLKYYDAFPRAKPDEFILIDDYRNIWKVADELIARNTIIIPHGSFVEYTTPEVFEQLPIPIFGNRKVLEWEADRSKERRWLEAAGLKMPSEIQEPGKIDRPVMIKSYGAKGGKGFYIVKNYEEFKTIENKLPSHYTIQEYILGTRYYIHYFYSPLRTDGYKVAEGTIELLSMDRRDETNIDEIYKLGSKEELKKHKIFPTFVVTGNVSVVLRESLLPTAFEMGERVVEKSIELFGGLIGPFSLETVVTDKLEFYVFEISARIVAGTNTFISGSPYSDLIEDRLSTGRRIAQEVKLGVKAGKLEKILT